MTMPSDHFYSIGTVKNKFGKDESYKLDFLLLRSAFSFFVGPAEYFIRFCSIFFILA